MSRSQWREDRAIHLPEVDAEHRSIYLLLAELKETAARDVPVADLSAKVRAFLADVEDHFAHEERLMQEAGYAMLSWHKRQHDTLRTRLADCAGRMQAGERKALRDLVRFASRWLNDHVAIADHMMGASLRNHQRSHAA